MCLFFVVVVSVVFLLLLLFSAVRVRLFSLVHFVVELFQVAYFGFSFTTLTLKLLLVVCSGRFFALIHH